MIDRRILPLTSAVVAISSAIAQAQTPFPAPLPGPQTTPPVGTFSSPPAGALTSPFGATGPIDGLTAPKHSDDDASKPCFSEFAPLREEAEHRGQLLREASALHAPADVTCKVIGNFLAAEVKMIRYVEVNAARCRIPPAILDQLKAGHKKTDYMAQRICNAAADASRRAPAGVASDFGDPVLFPGRSQLFRIAPEPTPNDGTLKRY